MIGVTGGIAGKKPEQASVSDKQQVASSDGGDDKQPVAAIRVEIHKKPEGGYHAKYDSGDGLGDDEMDHGSQDEHLAEYAKRLEEAYGEDKVEAEEEKIDPGIHEKVAESLAGRLGK